MICCHYLPLGLSKVICDLIMIACFVLYTERKGVSFIETSALDSTNVETAFRSLLTGSYALAFFCFFARIHFFSVAVLECCVCSCS